VLTDGRTVGRPEIIMPLPHIVGGEGIKIKNRWIN